MRPSVPCERRVTLRLVLADDSLLLREGIARLLTEAGFDVVAQVGDAEALLAAVSEHAPDVAIVDIRMPPTHTDEGLKAAEAIRAEHGTTVGILVLSQYVETTFALRLVADGAGGVGLSPQGPGRRPRGLLRRDPADRQGRVGDRPGGGRPARRTAPGQGAARRPDRAGARGPGADGRGPLEPGDQRGLFLAPKTVEAHIANIFSKLELLPAPDDHRRVLAVLAHLRG